MKRTNGFTIVAAIILGLTAVYWLYQAVGLIIVGKPANTYSFYLILAIIMIVLLFVSRRRLLLGGIITSTLGILMAVYFLMVQDTIYTAMPFLILMCVPLAASGLLFIEADWSSKKNLHT